MRYVSKRACRSQLFGIKSERQQHNTELALGVFFSFFFCLYSTNKRSYQQNKKLELTNFLFMCIFFFYCLRTGRSLESLASPHASPLNMGYLMPYSYHNGMAALTSALQPAMVSAPTTFLLLFLLGLSLDYANLLFYQSNRHDRTRSLFYKKGIKSSAQLV